LYGEPGDAPLEEALKRFEEIESLVRPSELQAWAERFSESRFRERMLDLIGRGASAHGSEFLLPRALQSVGG
jgi:hypothetical protein